MVMIESDEEKEKAHHRSAMQMLARDLGIPTADICALYERVLEELRKSARVKDFLSILASRQVKDLLRSRRAA